MTTTRGTPVVKTLLLTDFVDSTKFVETLGDVRAASVFAQHDRIARDLLQRFGGQEIDKTDGFLFIFSRPIDAVHYALAYNDALAELADELGQPLSARTGVHLGEVVLRENPPEDVARGSKPVELEGLAKPKAARIMSLAQGNQILMTQSAFELARRASVGDPDVPDDTLWLEHGQYLLKGIADPIKVYEVGRQSHAVLAPPPDSAKAHRHVTAAPRKSRGLLIAALALAAFFGLLLLSGAVALGLGLFANTSAPPESAKAVQEDPPEKTDPGALADKKAPIEDNKAAEDEKKAPAEVDKAPVEEKAPPTAVALKVVTEPPGAKVRLGRDQIGKSPATRDMPLAEGDYKVIAKLKGYKLGKATCTVTQEDVAKGESLCTVKLTRRGGASASAGNGGGSGGEGGGTGEKPKIHMID